MIKTQQSGSRRELLQPDKWCLLKRRRRRGRRKKRKRKKEEEEEETTSNIKLNGENYMFPPKIRKRKDVCSYPAIQQIGICGQYNKIKGRKIKT